MQRNLLLTLFFLICCCLVASANPDTVMVNTAPFVQQTSIGQVVVFSEDPQVNIRVYTMDGELLRSAIWKSRSHEGVKYEAGYDLDQGVYLVQIEQMGKTHYQKLVIRTS